MMRSRNLKVQTIGECRCEYCKPSMLAPVILIVGILTSWIVAKIYKENKAK